MSLSIIKIGLHIFVTFFVVFQRFFKAVLSQIMNSQSISKPRTIFSNYSKNKSVNELKQY